MPDNPAPLEAGQEVVLHDGRSGSFTRGTITKIGRVLVTIQGPYGREEKYRMDDQHVPDGNGSGRWFTTLEQEAAAAQRTADIATLADHGFKLDWQAKPADSILHMVAEFLRAQSNA
jgi:hypothetical protein